MNEPMHNRRRVLWPNLLRLAVDDPARSRMARNFARRHNRASEPWRAMSRKRNSYAWRVYQALCEHVNEAGEVWASYDRIAELTGLPKSHSSDGVARLIATGYAERVTTGRRGTAANYFLADIRAALIRKRDASDLRLTVSSIEVEGDWERSVQTIPESRIRNLTGRESVTHWPRIRNPVPFGESHNTSPSKGITSPGIRIGPRTGEPRTLADLVDAERARLARQKETADA